MQCSLAYGLTVTLVGRGIRRSVPQPLQPLLKGQVLQSPDLLGSCSLNSLQLLHDLPSGGRESDTSAVACIVLLAFPENGCNTCLLLLSYG